MIALLQKRWPTVTETEVDGQMVEVAVRVSSTSPPPLRAWPKNVQSFPGEQPNDEFIADAAVATTVLGAARAGMNCPEKQAWMMSRRFWNP